MKRQGVLVRLRTSIIAAAIGWAVATAASLPMPLIKIWSNVIGGWRPLLWSLGAGAGIWVFWTLAIVATAWLLGVLPAAMLVREQWLLEHKRFAITISGALAWLVVLTEFQFWRFFTYDYYFDGWLFTMYSLLLVVFATTTAAVYLRLTARIQVSSPGDASPGGA